MNLTVFILVHLIFVEATHTERRILPLSLQMAFVPDTKASHISGNKQAFVTEINLNHGTYQSNAYLMDSVSLSLHGSDTTICHSSSVANTETVNDPDSENNENGDENTSPFIFVFSNSTISMSHISLDCGWRGTSVGRISSSRLTIDHCPIISNPESSPFAIHNGWDDIGSSIFFADCSHKSIDKSSFLALVSLTSSHTTHSRHTNTVQEVSSTLVSCSGLSLCDTHLVFGSGPLVGFSSSTKQDTGLWNKLETVLIGSRLVNMTSGELNGSGKGSLERWSGCQKILDSCVIQLEVFDPSIQASSVLQELTSEEDLSDAEELLFKVPISLLPSSILTFGMTYTISSLKVGSDNVVVNSDVSFSVPNPPIVEAAQVHPNSINTSMTLDLNGAYLEMDGFYTVSLSPPFSFDMLFNSSTTVSSAELLLGRADCLQHNTKYTIVSITRVGNQSDVILTDGTVSFTTPKCLVTLMLHVNRKEGKDNGLCGESDHPCATIDFAWSIVSALRAKAAVLAIVNSSEQTQPIVVSAGMSIDYTNGGTGEPTVAILPSASMGDKTGMVVVSEAAFSIVDVTVKLESTDPSFVFLSASESTIILKEGSFVGEPLPTLSLNSENEELCSWESGVIKVNNCVMTLNRMTFSSLSQGAIHMKNGSVDVDGVIFRDNSPNLSSFPSARRNIRCVDGNVTIGSLNGGDGSKDHPSAWISTTDCTLSGDDARPNSALFVPTLSSESNITWMKKEKRFSVLIVGTTLIPCDLYLEVFEMKKDKSEGESERVELSFDTTDSFNETHINISINLTSLSSLDTSLEWRGRLVFGLNETTSEWFVLKSLSDRLSQSPLEHMKWWLPLVIVLLCGAIVAIVVIVVVLRRRRKQKAPKTPNVPEEMLDDVKLEVQDNSFAPNAIQTSAAVLKGKSLSQNGGDDIPQSTGSSAFNAGSHVGEQFVEVMDVESGQTKEIVKMETLFERLHKHKTEIVGKRQRQIEIARGLQKIGKTNGNASILQKLTSHWILIGADGHFNLQLKEDGAAAIETQSQSQAAGSGVANNTASVNINNENANGMDRAAIMVQEKKDQEGQRWQAPEQGELEAMPSGDLEKVTVFRLGLVLWEMESGQIPFRETDGVNAGRQLKAGVKPQMSLVGNKEMEELILKCLELKASDRIGLDDLISSLESIPDDPVPTQP
ncbi:hypothetical protein BLNAU_23092 [Blattamonas nauphoetae]|uniref:Protein kinase domain-containing protein n=1 Tax=Blattamonas nauphoetae TaxID=2049346 RepID=A0ABQ9WR62_9EUKA|nr:hypothetical protein BLNAU_23092 [Blattamonas nauphoetae]